MPRFKIGVVLESLGKPLREGLRIASALGVGGVQVDAFGPLAPDELSQSGRKEFRHLLRALNLELTALGCPLRHGFNVDYGLDARLGYVKKVLSLAYDLGPRMVVAFPGPLPKEDNPMARELLTHSLADLDRHGERVGSRLALEAGLEPADEFTDLLGRFTAGGLGVNVDPASVLGNGHDLVDAVHTFGTLVVHVHARDTRPHRADRDAREVPLGQGDVDWNQFLGALEAIEYRGWLTVKRGPCANPSSDVQQGVAFLRRLAN